MAVRKRVLKRAVKANWACYAVLAYFTFMVVACIAIYHLPSNVQEALKARSDLFNLLAAYTSIFVHASLEHLLNNVVGLLLFGLLVLVVAYYSDHVSMLLSSLVLVTVITPLASYLCSILFILFLWWSDKPISMCGLSGVVSSIAGFTIPFSGASLKKKLQINGRFLPFFTSSLTLLALLFVACVYNLVWFELSVLLLGFSLIPLICLLVSERRGLKKAVKSLDHKMLVSMIIDLICPSAFFASLTSLFPQQIFMMVSGGYIKVNILTHYVGLACGIFISYMVVTKQKTGASASHYS